MERERLTITLSPEILRRVDSVIDGARIRNRSHAIEYLLTTCFPVSVKKALVLAGGQGIKMRPFTYEMPKPMIPVNGRPILEHIIELLRSNDIRDIIISIGPLGDKIRNHFGSGEKFGVRIEYIEETKRSGTGGPILHHQELFQQGAFLVIYGDVLAEINLKDMIQFHENNHCLATMALTTIDKVGDWGVVGLQGSHVVSFSEKPKGHARSHLINAGIFIFEPEAVNYIAKRSISMLEEDVFPQLIKARQLRGYVFEGQWFDIATPEIYEQALKQWQK